MAWRQLNFHQSLILWLDLTKALRK